MGNEKSEHNCYEKQHTQNLSLQQSKHESYFDASNEDPNKDPDFGEKYSTTLRLFSRVQKGRKDSGDKKDIFP